MENPICPKGDPDFRLIETFGIYPDSGARHLDRHLRRMARSAGILGLPFDLNTAQARIAELVELHVDGPTRCRLTLTVDGRFDLTQAPLAANPDIWRVAIAPNRLHSQDPWLAHKTSRRAIYDAARAHIPDGVDELVFLNERDEICEGTITNLFLVDQKRTPALTCGVLPGIQREIALEQGYSEAIVTLSDLQNGGFMMGNSLRGFISAALV
ncbi:aminotransferase class IV family protein [Aestuariibius sp. HNIBRBA575]|uniref:aminotransferase class IV family protein n=1 Tax=Aestuariibius sp. HNIBRBA575 TaxID=3233343 RepID=UPI0034A2C3A5